MPESKNGDSKLAQYLRENATDESFPDHDTNYFDRFVLLDDWLNEHIHPIVNQGATAHDAIWLTDHGKGHISTVIRRASDLLSPDVGALTPYEAYVLLVACHFHDMGNVFGRAAHEKKCRKIMFGLPDILAGPDATEKRMICHIATAHGGYVDEAMQNKDTIGSLPYPKSRQKSNQSVRVQILAAVLRFADELADDHTRTSRFVIEQTKALYPGSEIYHIYADRLLRVPINAAEGSIDVQFELSTKIVDRRFKKQNKTRYLIEEIKDRTLKMHREHIYCGRFMLPVVLIERINVTILLLTADYSNVLGKIQYSMEQQGYPDAPNDLREICPKVEILSGKGLKLQARKHEKQNKISPYTEPYDLLDKSQWEG